ncbi:MAG: Orotidine 5'-phosphate decarboxylase [Candidatus Bathyarchaeota archaeon BA2]|nr:MAG: Orotidine 5'-phosphate decarboxylase [Candidatus Bathyarchaeota archaeon BA2]
MSFQLRMNQSAKKTGSNIVLALDLPVDQPNRLLSRSIEILEATHPYICAVKINRQLVLPLGLFNGVQKILSSAQDLGLPTIMDCKINDVGHTNRIIAEYYYKAGFDALTANPFVGWEEGLQPVFEVANKMHRGVILLVYMSHKATNEGYGQKIHDPKTSQLKPQYVAFAEKALTWNADGVIVGATYPEKIREVHEILGDRVPIYSPGIGIQGGKVEPVVKAGARYLVVGRTITLAENPAENAKFIRDIVRRCTKE